MTKSNSGNKSHPGYRDSIDGQFVTRRYAEQHPKTTLKESIPNPGRGDSDKRKK
jgi:hypothetical protein